MHNKVKGPVVNELIATEPTQVENSRLSFTLKLCIYKIFFCKKKKHNNQRIKTFFIKQIKRITIAYLG